MNLFFILLLIALIAAGYYVYQRLLAIEREIRADQSPLVEEESPVVNSGSESIASDSELRVDEGAPQQEMGELKDKIMLAVEGTPGLAQTELYAEFPEGDRRELQKLLRDLDHAGKLRREKKGSSYRLYPL